METKRTESMLDWSRDVHHRGPLCDVMVYNYVPLNCSLRGMTIRLAYFDWYHPMPFATEFRILVFYELKAFEILTFRQYCSDEGFHYL